MPEKRDKEAKERHCATHETGENEAGKVEAKPQHFQGSQAGTRNARSTSEESLLHCVPVRLGEGIGRGCRLPDTTRRQPRETTVLEDLSCGLRNLWVDGKGSKEIGGT